LARQLKEEEKENNRKGRVSNKEEDEGKPEFDSLNDEDDSSSDDSSSEDGGLDDYENEDNDSDSKEPSTSNLGFRSGVVGKTPQTS